MGTTITVPFADRKWVDRKGNNLSHATVREFIYKATGGDGNVDRIPRGGTYVNGGIWFQRID